MASYYELFKCLPEGATLTDMVKCLFEYLDYQEESESGRTFHPVTIGSCRVMFQEPLNDLLKRMKELSVKPCPHCDYDSWCNEGIKHEDLRSTR